MMHSHLTEVLAEERRRNLRDAVAGSSRSVRRRHVLRALWPLRRASYDHVDSST